MSVQAPCMCRGVLDRCRSPHQIALLRPAMMATTTHAATENTAISLASPPGRRSIPGASQGLGAETSPDLEQSASASHTDAAASSRREEQAADVIEGRPDVCHRAAAVRRHGRVRALVAEHIA